jgi:hypothetical protein
MIVTHMQQFIHDTIHSTAKPASALSSKTLSRKSCKVEKGIPLQDHNRHAAMQAAIIKGRPLINCNESYVRKIIYYIGDILKRISHVHII